jgi:hypothetical protein
MSFIDDNNPDAINHREWNWRIVSGDSAAPFVGPANLVVGGSGPAALGNPYTVKYSVDGDNPFFGGGVGPGSPPPYSVAQVARGREGYAALITSGAYIQSLDGGVTWNPLLLTGGLTLSAQSYDAPGGTGNGASGNLGPYNLLVWNAKFRVFVGFSGATLQVFNENGNSFAVSSAIRPLPSTANGSPAGLFFDPATGDTWALGPGTSGLDGYVLRSSDLITWTPVEALPGGFGANGGFSGMGRAGGFLFLITSAVLVATAIRSSDDGVTWASSLQDASTNFFNNIVCSEDGDIAIFRLFSSYWHSSDFGVTWNFIGDLPAPVGYGFQSGVSGITWREDLTPGFWLTMEQGPVYSSSDLLTWTERGGAPDADPSPWLGIA